MNRKLVPHHSHWGAFNAVVEDGKVVGAVPFDFDPDPSPLIEAIPDSVHSPLRIGRPMIRSGWLKDGRASGEVRGREPFVPVSWESALELVAGELGRVRREHGPSAIMGGSQGWSSAGHFHEARGQLRRFVAASGGHMDASDLIETLQNTLQGGGRPHMGNLRERASFLTRGQKICECFALEKS